MNNFEIYNYANRVGSDSLRNESTVSSTAVNVKETLKIIGAASGGSGGYRYAFYYKRGNTTEWTIKGTEYGTATTSDLSPYYEDTYQVKVNVKDSRGTVKTKFFFITSSAGAVSVSSDFTNAEMLDSSDCLTVENTEGDALAESVI